MNACMARLALAAALFAAGGTAFAGPPSAEDVLLGTTPGETRDEGAMVGIRQAGEGNSMIAIQRDLAEGLSAISATQTGADNLAVFYQSGSDNTASASQNGDGNLTVSQQLGLGNVLISQQTGDNLGVIVRQYGGSAISVTQSSQ